jgi:hypothetical protein
MDKRDLIKIFNDFLRKNMCFNRYAYNLKHLRNISKTFFFTTIGPSGWVNGTYSFGCTKEGTDYWNNINKLWENELMKLGAING